MLVLPRMLWRVEFDEERGAYSVVCANGYRVHLSEARRHDGLLRPTDESKAQIVADALNRLYSECPDDSLPVAK